MNGADLTSVIAVAERRGEDPEETRGLALTFAVAQKFITSFSCCERIEESFVGFGYSGIVAGFLFRISSARPGVDDWRWVIVGDLPPAYLVREGNLTPDLVVGAYICGITKWVEAVKEGRSLTQLIPVKAPAHQENARALEGRVQAPPQIIRNAMLRHRSRQVSREVD